MSEVNTLGMRRGVTFAVYDDGSRGFSTLWQLKIIQKAENLFKLYFSTEKLNFPTWKVFSNVLDSCRRVLECMPLEVQPIVHGLTSSTEFLVENY